MNQLKILVLLITSAVFGQTDTNPIAALKNLAPPSSPAFILMDLTPSNIIVPENIQAFSIQTISAFSNNSSNGLSNNNYAVEFQPYWYIKRENMNFFKYNNLKKNKEVRAANSSPEDYTCYNVFGDVWKRASISLALMNGNFNVFENAQSYVSVGARTRLLSFKTNVQRNAIISQYSTYEQFMTSQEVILIFANPSLSASEKNTAITNLDTYKTIVEDFESTINRKPLFALDVAVAYSHFMGDKSQDLGDAFGRFGAWASGDLAFNTPTIGDNSYIHFYGVFRYLRDGLNIDPETTELTIEEALDYGGKLEFEFDKVAFAFEYITRDINNENEERSIGSIRYRINEAFTITGGFGKNFRSDEETVALFGIQWGIDFGNSVSLNSN